MIKCVIFDIGGVLLTLGEMEYRRQAFSRLGCTLAYEDYLKSYEERVNMVQRGDIDEGAFWCGLAGKPVGHDQFDGIWLSLFRPIPEMLELAKDIAKRGIKISLLSNTQPSHVRLMRQMDFLEGFDPIVFSCEVGCRKPEPEIFQLVLDYHGILPSEAIFIDDIEINVDAAKKMGIHGIVHRNYEKTVGELARLLDLGEVSWNQ